MQRRIVLEYAAMALSACFALGCSHAVSDTEPAESKRRLTILSKAPESGYTFSSIEVIAFNDDNSDHIYSRVRTTAPPLQLHLDDGIYRIFVLVNLPEFQGTSEDELFGMGADLTCSTPEYPSMVSGAEITVNGDDQIEFELERLWCRIVLEGPVTMDSGTVRSIFLINIPKVRPLFSPITGLPMYNHRGIGIDSRGEVSDPLAPKFTYYNSADLGRLPLTFYGYPNQSTEAFSRKNEDDVTKLVVAAEQNGNIRYFPIGLPDLESNKSYSISGIHINDRPGSTSPNRYVQDTEAFTYTITVKEFTNHPLSESI